MSRHLLSPFLLAKEGSLNNTTDAVKGQLLRGEHMRKKEFAAWRKRTFSPGWWRLGSKSFRAPRRRWLMSGFLSIRLEGLGKVKGGLVIDPFQID